jgi:hypothetical protein
VAKQVQQAMKKKDIIVIADKGYFSRIYYFKYISDILTQVLRK